MQRPHSCCAPRTGKPCSSSEVGACQTGNFALILGAVIAGGKASRFGSDKAEALLDGIALIDHCVHLLERHTAKVVIVGRKRCGATCLADRPRAGLGPLGGIAAALHHGASGGYERVVTIACDMPFLPSALITMLVTAAPAYCRDAPVLGCWPSALSEALDQHLALNVGRSVYGWGASIGAKAIPSPGPLVNVNTLADLAAL